MSRFFKLLLLNGFLVGFVFISVPTSGDPQSDLVRLQQQYRLAAGIAELCPKLDKLIAVREGVNRFVKEHPGTEAAAKIATGQSVGNINPSNLESIIEELRYAVAVASQELYDAALSTYQRAAASNKLAEKISLLDLVSSQLRRIENEYACSTVDLVDLKKSVALLNTQVYIERESAAEQAINDWKRETLGIAIQNDSTCDRVEALVAALNSYQEIALDHKGSYIIEDYEKSTGDHLSSLVGLHELIQVVSDECGKEQSVRNKLAFTKIVEIKKAYERALNQDAESARLAVLESVVQDIELLLERYPESKVSETVKQTGCFGDLCLEQIKLLVTQTRAEIAQYEAAAEEALEQLRAHAECGNNIDRKARDRLNCLKRAIETYDDIQLTYFNSKASECLRVHKQCEKLVKSVLTVQLQLLLESCEAIVAKNIKISQEIIEELTGERRPRLIEQRINLLHELQSNYRVIELNHHCSVQADRVIKEEGFNNMKMQDIAKEYLAAKSRFSRAEKEHLSIQKECAGALARSLSRKDIRRLRKCGTRLDSYIKAFEDTIFARNISSNLPIIPTIDWQEESIELSTDSDYQANGYINGHPAEFIIDPEIPQSRISPELASELKLSPSIKSRVESATGVREYVNTLIRSIEIGSLDLPNIAALIDPDLQAGQITLGVDALRSCDWTESEAVLSIRRGTVRPGSETDLGITRSTIQEKLDSLITAALDEFDKQLGSLETEIEEVRRIQSIDQYGEKIQTLGGLANSIRELVEEYSEIQGYRKSRVNSIENTLNKITDEARVSREKFALDLCTKCQTISDLIAVADDISVIKDELTNCRSYLERLSRYFKGTELVNSLNSNETRCGLSRSTIQLETRISGIYQEALDCQSRGLKSERYVERTNAYQCAIDRLNRIAEQRDESVLASRVHEGDEISMLSKIQLQKLIQIEEKAKAKLALAKDLQGEAENEDRLPKRYDLLLEALEELEYVSTLDVAVDPQKLIPEIDRLKLKLVELTEIIPVEPELISISGDCFMMGGVSGDVDSADDERSHEACVDDYEIGIYEVTFHEYDRYTRNNGLPLVDDMGWGRGFLPVINVSLMDVIEYVEWLSYQTGKSYRLPTEAEWEYAARGDEQTIFPWGNRVGRGRANCLNCGSEWDGRSTAPVGSFKPNAYGLYDMSGNVAERTCSIYRENFDDRELTCADLEASGGRVVRGGSWKSHARNVRVSYRFSSEEIDRKSRFRGFRLVRD